MFQGVAICAEREQSFSEFAKSLVKLYQTVSEEDRRKISQVLLSQSRSWGMLLYFSQSAADQSKQSAAYQFRNRLLEKIGKDDQEIAREFIDWCENHKQLIENYYNACSSVISDQVEPESKEAVQAQVLIQELVETGPRQQSRDEVYAPMKNLAR